ncbi:MAG: TRAP transporter large permease subunit [Bacillota bacterium]
MLAALLFGLFAGLVLLSVPIAISLALATTLTIYVTEVVHIQIVAQRMFTAIDSFPTIVVRRKRPL